MPELTRIRSLYDRIRSGKPHWVYNTRYLHVVSNRKSIEWTPNTIASKVEIDGSKARITRKPFPGIAHKNSEDRASILEVATERIITTEKEPVFSIQKLKKYEKIFAFNYRIDFPIPVD